MLLIWGTKSRVESGGVVVFPTPGLPQELGGDRLDATNHAGGLPNDDPGITLRRRSWAAEKEPEGTDQPTVRM
jgi:hypothetical protein